MKIWVDLTNSPHVNFFKPFINKWRKEDVEIITRQLYHFIDCIQGKTEKNQCSFSDGVATLDVIENLFTDYEQNAKL